MDLIIIIIPCVVRLQGFGAIHVNYVAVQLNWSFALFQRQTWCLGPSSFTF